MTATAESARSRRYLLGETSDHERAVIEREYLEDAEAFDRIESAEDDLIEDYLTDRLSSGERIRFERMYLEVPHRRARVDTIRRLMAIGSQPAQSHPGRPAPAERQSTRRGYWMALAASLLAGALGALWVFSPVGNGRAEIVESMTPAGLPPADGDRAASALTNAPRLFALALSPAAVRSESGAGVAVIPPHANVVVIRLERDAGDLVLTPRRASVHIVGGVEVWRGPVTLDEDPAPSTVARVDVPAVSLLPDDYLITLYGTDAAGVERAWTQYFLRVRLNE